MSWELMFIVEMNSSLCVEVRILSHCLALLESRGLLLSAVHSTRMLTRSVTLSLCGLHVLVLLPGVLHKR